LSAELEGSALRVRDSHAGLHFIAVLPRKVRDVDFARRAAGHAIVTPPLSSYFIARPALNGVLIGFAATAPPAAKRAVATLKGLLIR
jgi:DNA-binding transcriptional MocR family regulator